MQALQRVHSLDPNIILSRDTTIKVWQEHGRSLGLSESGAPEATPEGPDLSEANACGNALCLCHVQKPPHQMRVCKGCWSVMYCNAKCQARSAIMHHGPTLLSKLTVIF